MGIVLVSTHIITFFDGSSSIVADRVKKKKDDA
jgi:hypothetical protein